MPLESVSPPMGAMGLWALCTLPSDQLGLGPTGKARGTPDREKPVAPPLGGEYSREEAR